MASNPRQITSADLIFSRNPSINYLNFYCIKHTCFSLDFAFCIGSTSTFYISICKILKCAPPVIDWFRQQGVHFVFWLFSVTMLVYSTETPPPPPPSSYLVMRPSPWSCLAWYPGPISRAFSWYFIYRYAIYKYTIFLDIGPEYQARLCQAASFSYCSRIISLVL